MVGAYTITQTHTYAQSYIENTVISLKKNRYVIYTYDLKIQKQLQVKILRSAWLQRLPRLHTVLFKLSSWI